MTGPGLDALDELSGRVRAAQRRQSASSSRRPASRAPRPVTTPRRPRATRLGEREPRDERSAEAQAIAALLDLGRAMVPPELRWPAALTLVRELLLLRCAR